MRVDFVRWGRDSVGELGNRLSSSGSYYRSHGVPGIDGTTMDWLTMIWSGHLYQIGRLAAEQVLGYSVAGGSQAVPVTWHARWGPTRIRHPIHPISQVSQSCLDTLQRLLSAGLNARDGRVVECP